MPELEGKTIGRYELRRLIGKGGMANVYEAFDALRGQVIAVKVFKREDEELLRRFLREAQLMSSLQGHHLVPIYDSGTALLDNALHYYIAMPYMEGGTLRVRIRRGPMGLDEACRAIGSIADALNYIHSRGIIHRDIKASNVLIGGDGDYYLTDFGIARITDDLTHLTTTGNVLGTVDYVAPELFELDRKADALSDLYSLGILLYEMVTGRLPFVAENQIALVSMHIRHRPPAPRSINSTIPPQVERVMLKALEKRPEQRYQSAKELADAFCDAVSGGAPGAQGDVAEAAVAGAPAFRPDQLILSAPPADGAGAAPQERPSPLEAGTIGFASPPYRRADQVAHSPYPEQPINAPPLSAPAFRPPSALWSQPESPTRRRPFYRRAWFALLVAFLALVIIGGSISALYLPRAGSGTGQKNGTASTATTGAATTAPSPAVTPNLTATALAAQNATATAQAQASATAIARVTATAAARASATAGVIATATSGQPAYQDALNNANNSATAAAGWDMSDNCAFKSDGYHDSATKGLQGCKEANNTYMNAAITVDMHLNSGQSGGLFFRMNAPFYLIGGYTGYLFEVDGTGHYRVLSSSNFNGGSPSVLQDWTTSSALRKGSATNTLQLIMRGSDFYLYANGAYLTHVNDSSYSSGQIAFLARSDGTTPADLSYSNLAVYPSA